jgi:NADH dehydrogenase FAD-containing subunit
MNMTPRIVVLGGGYAGVLAALRAKARAGDRADVVLVSDDDDLTERVRLHEAAVRPRDVRHPLRQLVGGTGVELLRARVARIDADALASDRGEIPYDALIVAAGSATPEPSVPGAREHSHRLEPWAVEGIRARLDAFGDRRRHVVVVGGGLTGIEIASEIAEAHPALSVSLVTSGVVGELLSKRARAAVTKGLVKLGIQVVEGFRVAEVTATHVVGDRADLPCDLAIWTGGFRASPLAAEGGFAVNARGQFRVDPFLRAVGRERVFVAGDAAAPDVAPGDRVELGCKSAMPMGVHAAENAVRSLLGGDLAPFDLRDTGYCISLGRRDGVIESKALGAVWTGRLAAFVKEQIVRFTVASLRWEAAGRLRYRWVRTGHAPRALPPAVSLAVETSSR